MDSVERLISLVQSQPCLYNSSHKHYRNSAQKELVWQKISQELQQSCESTKNKWKNLKDGYTKYKKHKKGGAGQKKPYAKWIWGPYLKFLDAHAHTKATSPDADGNASPSSQGYDMEDDGSSSPAVPCEVMLPSPTLQSSRLWSSDEQDVMHQILEHMKNERKNDAADHLFASYAETFKKLKPRTQHSIKLQLAQIFADAELKDLGPDCVELNMLPPVCCIKTAPSDS